jgi:hypothetical protein
MPDPTDLFGHIPVYENEVWAWLIAVPKIDPACWRARHYLESWNVPEKIRRWKLDHGQLLFTSDEYERSLRFHRWRLR